MANIADLFGRLLLDDSGFEAAVVKSAQAAGDKAGLTMGQSLTKSLKVGGLAGLSVLFAGAAKGALELDVAVQQYAADVGASAEETDKAKAAASELFKTNRQGYDEILQTLAKLRTDQGLTVDEASAMADAYLKFAKVAKTDAPSAVTAFDDILDAFNLTAKDSGRLMDLLVASNQKYGGSLVQRLADLKSLAPALQGLNLNVEDGIALENLFATAGLDAGSAQRALNTAVSKLKPGQTFDDLIQSISSIEDPTLRAQKAIDIFGVRGGTVLAQALRPGIDSLDDLKVNATDAADSVTKASDAIDSSIPAQFQLALKGVMGTLSALIGPAGAIASVITALSSLGLTFDILKATAISSWLATLGPVALAAGAGLAFIALIDATKATDQAQRLAATSAGDLAGAQAKLKAQAEAGTITWDQYDSQLDDVMAKQELQARMAVLAAGGTNEAADAAGKAAAANDRGATAAELAALASATQAAAIDKVVAAQSGATASALLTMSATDRVWDAQLRVAQATVDAATAHAALKEAQAAAVDSATAGAAATEALAAAQIADQVAVDNLKAAQDALTSAQSAAILSALNASDAWKAYTGTLSGAQFTAHQLIADLITLNGMHVEATVDLKVGGVEAVTNFNYGPSDRAIADAKASAADYARTVKSQMSDAFRAAKASSDAFFADLHRSRLVDIEDERARVNAELEAQKKALFEGVDAAQAALDAKRQAEQRRGLQRDVTKAALGIGEAGDDPQAIAEAVGRLRDARRALADFDAQADIDAKRAAAQAASDQLAAAQKANDDKAALAVEGENKTAAARQKAFDDGLAKLEDQLLTEKGSHTKTLAAITKLYVDAGISSKSQGAQIALGLAAGLLSEIKAVESAAKTLAAAVAKYIKVGSPAEAGPFHDDPPDAMGRRLAGEFGKGLLGGFADLGPALKVIAGGMEALGIGPVPSGPAAQSNVANVAGGIQVPAVSAALAGGPIAPSAAVAAVPSLAGGDGTLHVHVDLGEEFARQFGGNRFIDKVSAGLAWRRRTT